MGRQDKEDKDKKPESLFESFSRLGRAKDTANKGGDMVTNIQNFAKQEAERKRKEAEAAKAKTTTGVATAPEDGFLTRMYKKYVSGGK